jgi:protein-S-isoprenylcysteine O-methyltransferase Ste14
MRWGFGSGMDTAACRSRILTAHRAQPLTWADNAPNRWMCGNVHGTAQEKLPGSIVITLGIILLVVGFLLKISILWAIGIILVVLGAILALLGAAGRAVFGRRHYW